MKIEIQKMSLEDAKKLGIDNWGSWGCEISKFDWEYSDKESAYVFEGKVVVQTDYEEVEINGGDFVVFPKGLKCTWDVKEPIRKVFKFG